MIPQYKAPHLNRKERRHPSKGLTITKGGMNWLMMGLMIHAGWYKVPKPAATEQAAREQIISEQKADGFVFPNKPAGFVARAKGAFRKLFGRA